MDIKFCKTTYWEIFSVILLIISQKSFQFENILRIKEQFDTQICSLKKLIIC